MARYGLVIDVPRCSGCCCCLLAVKDEYVGNDYPGYSAPQPATEHNWLDVIEVEQGEGDKVKVDYIPVMHPHDRNMKPIPGAPEGAVYVRGDGLTIIDPEKARGHKEIMDAFPCGSVFWNEELQLPQIYTLDAHRLDEGEKLPRCVESCPTDAMHWGDLDDPCSDVSVFTASHEDEIEDFRPTLGADFAVRYYRLPRPFIAGEAVLEDSPGECCGGALAVLTRNGRALAETRTDFLGDFEFARLEKGVDYAVTVSYPGYEARTLEVRLDKAVNLGAISLARRT